MLQAKCDCLISMCCDFQDPVEMLPVFVREWENGYKIVCGIKTTSKESKIMYFLRSVYYKLIKKMSKVEQIEHFTGFGLYDKSFVEVLRNLKDPTPFIRGIVAELGPKIKKIEYQQEKRRAGKTSNNFFSLYDAAMLSVTSYTKVGVRIASFAGILMSGLSALGALACLIIELIDPEIITSGTLPIICAIFFVAGMQMFVTGFIGEYIMSMNARIMNRPLVIEEERINFD